VLTVVVLLATGCRARHRVLAHHRVVLLAPVDWLAAAVFLTTV
jgi:hypothetical protein